MVGHLLADYLAVPLLQDVQEKVEVLVGLVEGVPVELLEFEGGVGLRLEQQLDVLFEAGPVLHVDNALQGGAHYSIEYYTF